MKNLKVFLIQTTNNILKTKRFKINLILHLKIHLLKSPKTIVYKNNIIKAAIMLSVKASY